MIFNVNIKCSVMHMGNRNRMVEYEFGGQLNILAVTLKSGPPRDGFANVWGPGHFFEPDCTNRDLFFIFYYQIDIT